MAKYAIGVPDHIKEWLEHNGIDVNRCSQVTIEMEAGAVATIQVKMLALGTPVLPDAIETECGWRIEIDE